jgi:hypothetical protein
MKAKQMAAMIVVRSQDSSELATRLQKWTCMFSQKMSDGSGALSKVQELVPRQQHEHIFLQHVLQDRSSCCFNKSATSPGLLRTMNTIPVKLFPWSSADSSEAFFSSSAIFSYSSASSASISSGTQGLFESKPADLLGASLGHSVGLLMIS